MRDEVTLTPVPGALFTKPWNVLPPDLVKSRGRKIRVCSCPIALKKYERRLGNNAVGAPDMFRSIQWFYYKFSQFRDIPRFGVETSYCLVNRGPDIELHYIMSSPIIAQWCMDAVLLKSVGDKTPRDQMYISCSYFIMDTGAQLPKLRQVNVQVVLDKQRHTA